ncbi:MAG: hypothetical protein AB7O74_03015 [Candidatus Nanopelagicales bacterium]
MSTPTEGPNDPIADERGEQGTNYPHGVGDAPDAGNPDANPADEVDLREG